MKSLHVIMNEICFCDEVDIFKCFDVRSGGNAKAFPFPVVSQLSRDSVQQRHSSFVRRHRDTALKVACSGNVQLLFTMVWFSDHFAPKLRCSWPLSVSGLAVVTSNYSALLVFQSTLSARNRSQVLCWTRQSP
jgi:hypothetical protein